ncbi:MAG: ABC transporter ATP-binding protein [Rhodospirillaceae bacterium]|nr:ABC transporter ATP-binding protein [Rhodospirillaceae bacterium]
MNTAPPLVEFQRATKSFITQKSEVLRALQDVSFSVSEGEFIAIVGPSGCGKTTTLNVLAGLTTLTSGRALLGGRQPGEAKMDVGYVFQQDSVLPWKKVIDNIQIGLKLRKVPARAARQRAEDLLRLTGLTGFADAFPAELSGGMRKRVALATTLAYDPSVLLMDEPFGALDAQTRVILQDELLRIWNERRQTVLFVTHDIAEAIAMADRVIVMTARPARIKLEYKIDLPRPRSAADVRFDPRFDELHKSIWNDLKPEIAAQAGISGGAA